MMTAMTQVPLTHDLLSITVKGLAAMRVPSLLFGAQEAHGIRGNTPTVINPWIILEYAKRFCSFTVNI